MAVKVQPSLPPRAGSNQPGRPVPPPLCPGALSVSVLTPLHPLAAQIYEAPVLFHLLPSK